MAREECKLICCIASVIEPHLATLSAGDTIIPPLEQARRWLSTCQDEHDRCSVKKELELPTRLVRVEKDGQTLSAQLCESLSLPPDTEYLTLSHCWGTTPFLNLTKENIEQMKVSIPIVSLPQLFQDAVRATHELGFNYIWIDSLCIIQNSDGGADWLRESPTMDRIYGNSACNLSATGFSDGQNGLLVTADVREIFPPSIDCTKFVKNNVEYSVLPRTDWTSEVWGGPLNARGWVFQEQIMVG